MGVTEAQPSELTFEQMLERITVLIDELENAEPAIREPALELLDYLEMWHREGITRLATGVPAEALETAREDPVVAHLLDTYLGEDEEADPTSAIEDALEQIRPYVHSHGGEMEVVAVDPEAGVVTLRLLGSCDGCPSSAVTLSQGVEQILRERWSGFRRLEVEGDEGARAQPKLLQIQSLKQG